MSSVLEVIAARHKPTAAVVFLHGSGDTGRGAKSWVEFLLQDKAALPHANIYFPTAPIRSYSAVGGEMRNVWFDRKSITPEAKEDKETLDSITDQVVELIKKEVAKDIALENVIIGGFSMGGALAMHLTYKRLQEVAGCFSLSAFLNNDSSVFTALSEKEGSRFPPLLHYHGDRDELVPLKWGEATVEKLKSHNVDVEFKVLKNTLHEMKTRELEEVWSWINKLIPS